MRRRAVFEHIKELAQGCFGTAHTLVSVYGSVPLRAYLPDGDIDVCLLGDHRVIDKASWTTKFQKHIEKVEAESDFEFAVSEVSVINAEVRLMKCIVDGMMVDVSANQFGGLASLGFLEETNAFIGRDDLFVRSIILVKAWGFYEGRILGAHHALIATYALETLVLYIINKYYAELTCPLSVLHKLLRVFGYVLTIHGPVALEDANNIPPGCLEGGLLTEEFMQSMLCQYGQIETSNSAPVVVKYMNIIDPLVPNNNLGRSVSCGNYRRVRAALRLGARHLDKLMERSERGMTWLQPRALLLNDEDELEDLDGDASANHWPTLGDPPSPDRLKRTDSHGSVSEQQRGIHWGRWDVLVDQQRDMDVSDQQDSGDTIDNDSAKLSASPPESDASGDAGERNDSNDGANDANSSPPIPEDAKTPGINDIFTGCLNTIREHLAFGVYHHARALERQRAGARQSVDDRRRNAGNRRGNGKPPYSRSRNSSRSNKASKNGSQQGFQPPPPPGAPPPGTVKRGYASDSNPSNGSLLDESHFPSVKAALNKDTAMEAPQRPRSPRPSPTFPQVWSGVANVPAKFFNDENSTGDITTSEIVISDEMRNKLTTIVEPPTPPATPPLSVSTPDSPARPVWGPKGSAPIDILKANAEKSVNERQTAPSEETVAPLVSECTASEQHSDDSAGPAVDTPAMPTKGKRVRTRRNRQRIPDAECDIAFPSLNGGPAETQASTQAQQSQPTSWAKLL
ncbi:hypothetical protein BE221DRAFT_195624 [Ostreococcus tauri]|uniref:Polymerase nucleotidyl transferase domain-containing protein n=1 Tax=Ostreococcus tauri TaxID=70448 RepID=A0A1Y5I6I1_OSTTA|nr:hypothetical protein BE221DRAFT_195624 [Ostreococcus tauri]